MKRIIGIMMATAAIATLPATAHASDRDRDRHHYRDRDHRVVVVKKAPQRHTWKRYRQGERFDRRYARNYREVSYRESRRLRPPPRGYRYVRSGDDVLLIGITSGIVSAVFSNLLR
ncbi:RcnB family protein [Qipengyuania sp. JC766]|uniref:RcnB family protein n=1 Tax=Qipengyuania sp. JC766 TaxID=3232139 RepID=UPI0034579158